MPFRFLSPVPRHSESTYWTSQVYSLLWNLNGKKSVRQDQEEAHKTSLKALSSHPILLPQGIRIWAHDVPDWNPKGSPKAQR